MPLTPRSPDWWADRLWSKLQRRTPDVRKYQAYADGKAPYPWLKDEAAEAFAQILRLSRSNYMGLVVDATYERLKVKGFRRDGKPDDWAWKVWQASNLDRWAPQGMKQAVTCGQSYLLVEPRGEGRRPRITVEDATQSIVEYEPGDYSRVAAGLRAWTDDTGDRPMTHAVLYLPDRTLYLGGVQGSPPAKWDHRKEEQPNHYDQVPLQEMPNAPDLFNVGKSEIDDVIDIQDRVNKTIMDRLVTQDYGAFPQKFAQGWPEEEDDPEHDVVYEGDSTHPDVERMARNAADGPPFHIGRNRLVTAPDGVEFGQFETAPMDPYSAAKREDVKDISARTRIPPHFLLGDIANMSADGLIAAESGLIAKIHDRKEPFSDAFEDALRLAARMDPEAPKQDLDGLETLWKDVEFRSIAQLTDALGKARQMLGVPDEALWERWGAGTEEISRWRDMQADQAVRTLGTDIAGLLGTDVPAGARMDPDELAKRANAAGILIRSGFDPEDALTTAGLDPIEHSGLLPVTLQSED